MNITEKILARASGSKKVSPGDILDVNIDVAYANDLLATVPSFAPKFKKLIEKGGKIWNLEKFFVIIDHFSPPSTVVQSTANAIIRKFVREYGVRYFYQHEGISHQLMPEKGHVRPGEVIVATDSHTTTCGAFGAFGTGIGTTEMAWVLIKGNLWFRVPDSILYRINGEMPDLVMAKDLILHILQERGMSDAVYKAMEFVGPTLKNMSIDERMVLCNMAVEAGAKNGIINPDAKTIDYVKSRTKKQFMPLTSDPDAEYFTTYDIAASKLEPLVAYPHNTSNVKTARELQGVNINQALIGTCTGGRISDLKIAAKILKGRRISGDVRCIVVPASKEVAMAAIKEGLISILMEAGAIVCNPNCGPCCGQHEGVLAPGEVTISAQNRNFRGRAGSVEAKIYLASPATVAASAVKGEITDPRDI